ncbi:MAG: hypothetical protein MCS20_02335, partial [Candidatus Phytoplasma mali]|nr:hypothetical protein [Candidatus Phytoplasma mali]
FNSKQVGKFDLSLLNMQNILQCNGSTHVLSIYIFIYIYIYIYIYYAMDQQTFFPNIYFAISILESTSP